MSELILTGASRGIGRALAHELARRRPGRKLWLVARSRGELESLVREIEGAGGRGEAVEGDLGTIDGAGALGERLAGVVGPGSDLIHNAGIWPTQLEIGPDGFERSWVVNHLGPLLMQDALLRAGRLRRILVVSAGLIVKARFDASRTPRGADFSRIRSYCNTKLAFAIAAHALGERHPELQVCALHPGVVRTNLGDSRGVLGAILRRIKRRWEAPERCAARLAELVDAASWAKPGQPCWRFEATETPWPDLVVDPTMNAAVRDATRQAVGPVAPFD